MKHESFLLAKSVLEMTQRNRELPRMRRVLQKLAEAVQREKEFAARRRQEIYGGYYERQVV